MHVTAGNPHIFQHPFFLLQKSRNFTVLALPGHPFARNPQQVLGARDEDESLCVMFGISHRLSPISGGNNRYMGLLALFDQRMLFIASINFINE